MAKYKPYDYRQDVMVAVNLSEQLHPGTLEHTILFGELRSGAVAMTDDDLATELARAFLAYLTVASRPA